MREKVSQLTQPVQQHILATANNLGQFVLSLKIPPLNQVVIPIEPPYELIHTLPGFAMSIREHQHSAMAYFAIAAEKQECHLLKLVRKQDRAMGVRINHPQQRQSKPHEKWQSIMVFNSDNLPSAQELRNVLDDCFNQLIDILHAKITGFPS
jgi:hypothetical protein